RRTIAALDPEEHLLVVAERRGELVAMAQLVRSESANGRHRAEVRRVAVATRARGHGVGRQLMEVIEELARTRGIALLWLTTHAETPACSFYEAGGFTLLGVHARLLRSSRRVARRGGVLLPAGRMGGAARVRP